MGDLIDAALRTGRQLLAPHGPAVPAQAASFAPGDYSVHFFLQLGIILIACRAVGALGRRLGQPQVVGEMVAGVLLGPSLLGWLAPGAEAAIFPQATRPVLYAGAQLGVGLYMFLVGLTLDLHLLRERARGALGVSAAGIVVAFAVAAPLSAWLLEQPGLFGRGVSPGSAALFLGACVGLTAFPMLARIITERGLAGSPVGLLSLTAGALDDAVSWCVLAAVLASTGGGPGVAVVAIGGGLLFAAFLALFGRRLLAPLGAAVERAGTLSPGVLAVTLALFCLAAFAMDAVGIHAVFGGFALGVAMPRGRFAEQVRRTAEPVVTVLLLPLFFTYSGLNTRLDLFNSASLLLAMLVILAASVLAKFGACWAAARLGGESNRTALAIGALMNARGLMELIIVDIGLRRSVIEPALGTMLVTMAVVTTAMVGPVFDRLQRPRAAGEPGDRDGPAPVRTPG